MIINARYMTFWTLWIVATLFSHIALDGRFKVAQIGVMFCTFFAGVITGYALKEQEHLYR